MVRETTVVQNAKLWKRLLNALFNKIARPTRLATKTLPITMPVASAQDWATTLDHMKVLLALMHDELTLRQDSPSQGEAIEVIAYLDNINHLLAKIRECLAVLNYRKNQFAQQRELIDQNEFIKVEKSLTQCCHTICKLIQIMQQRTSKNLYSDEFFNQIHALGLETSSLGSAICLLNEWCIRQEAIAQSQLLEQNLFKSLLEAQLLQQERGLYHVNHSYQKNKISSLEFLRVKVNDIPDLDYQIFVTNLVNIYETLKSCYVLAQKHVIKDTLSKIAFAIDELAEEFCKPNPQELQIYYYLNEICHHLEALRFSSNRHAGSSRNLFNKAKLAQHRLRQACLTTPIGMNFLQMIAVDRESLVKDKKKIR